MLYLILFFVVSIVFSFLCSVLEAVLLSITPSYIQTVTKENKSLGMKLMYYKKDIDRPLSAILTLNTIAHTVGAIGVGASVKSAFGETMKFDFYFFEIGAEPMVAGLMTLAILILSEIIPKTIGANNWKRLTPFTVRSLRVLILVLQPLVWLSQLITKSLKNEKDRSVLSRADFAAMTAEGEKTGALDKSESTIINNLLAFEKLTVREIMTPKTVVLMANEEMTVSEFYTEHDPLPFSRIPIYRQDKDNVTGIVLKDELLKHMAEDKDDVKLKDLKREVAVVEDDLPLTGFFEQLTNKKQHLNIVVDEFGIVLGIITMEDMFESLLGKEIVDESDRVVNMQELAKKKWAERFKNKNQKPPEKK